MLKKNDYSIRESGFELLRIIAIVGIVFMHTWGMGKGFADSMEPNWLVSLGINSIFQAGVTCFALVSGYFGVNSDSRKLHSLHLVAVFYSVLSFLIEYFVLDEGFDARNFISAFVPVCSKKYWFLTSYMYLCFLSPFINKCISVMKKKEFFLGICTMVLVFYLIPTVFFFAPDTMSDSGKGLANMITIYLIGRYIRMNEIEWSKGKSLGIMAAAWLVTFLGDAFLHCAIKYVLKIEVGLRFCRDCSLSMLVCSIAVFMLFKNFKFKSWLINAVATNVFAVYLFSGPISKIYERIFKMGGYSDTMELLAATIAIVLLTVCTCIMINLLRQVLFQSMDYHLINLSILMERKIWNKSFKLMAKK